MTIRRIRGERDFRLIAGAFFVVALLYRVWAVTGDMMYDPVIYAQNAFNILQGTFTLASDSWYAHRLPVFLPVVPCYAAFGVGTWSSKLWPLAASMGQLAFVWLLGRRLLGPGPALIALSIAAVAPLDVVYAGVLNPDIVISAFMTASVAAWVLAHPSDALGFGPAPQVLSSASGSQSNNHRSGNEARGKVSTSPHRGWILLSGACWALAMTTREFAVILGPFFLGWVLWLRRPMRETLVTVTWFGAGAAVVFVPLAVAYHVQTGDVLYRLGVLSGRYGEKTKSEGTQFLYYAWLMMHPRYAITGLMPHLSVLAVIAALIFPTRVRVLILLWALPIALYLQFGSMSTTEYIPILKRDRFLMPLTAPCALLAASVLPELLRRIAALRRLARVLVPAGLILFALAGLVVVANQRADGKRRASDFAGVVTLISRKPDLPVLFDHWRSGYRFSYFLDFKEGADFYRGGLDSDRTKSPGAFGDSRLGYISWYPRSEDLPSCYVVLDDIVLKEVRAGNSVTQTYRLGELPAYAYEIPSSWTPVGQAGTFRVYEVTRAANAP